MWNDCQWVVYCCNSNKNISQLAYSYLCTVRIWFFFFCHCNQCHILKNHCANPTLNIFQICCSRYEESAVKVETPSVEEPGIFQTLEQLEETAEALLTRLRMWNNLALNSSEKWKSVLRSSGSGSDFDHNFGSGSSSSSSYIHILALSTVLK